MQKLKERKLTLSYFLFKFIHIAIFSRITVLFEIMEDY